MQANVKWFSPERMGTILNCYLPALEDGNPIAVRQAIQGLASIVEAHPTYSRVIANRSMSINLDTIRLSMQKLILFDRLNILHSLEMDKTIRIYLEQAVERNILDQKQQETVESWLC